MLVRKNIPNCLHHARGTDGEGPSCQGKSWEAVGRRGRGHGSRYGMGQNKRPVLKLKVIMVIGYIWVCLMGKSWQINYFFRLMVNMYGLWLMDIHGYYIMGNGSWLYKVVPPPSYVSWFINHSK